MGFNSGFKGLNGWIWCAVAPDRNCTSIVRVALLHCYSKPQTRHNKYAVLTFPYSLGLYYVPISKLCGAESFL